MRRNRSHLLNGRSRQSLRFRKYGAAVIVFALLLRALLLPLGLWSIRQQRQFADIQQRMKPRLQEINKTLKGAEKSEAVFQTYKDYGISPFSGLKGSIGLFVQLPILIALFAVTTESAMFRDAVVSLDSRPVTAGQHDTITVCSTRYGALSEYLADPARCDLRGSCADSISLSGPRWRDLAALGPDIGYYIRSLFLSVCRSVGTVLDNRQHSTDF